MPAAQNPLAGQVLPPIRQAAASREEAREEWATGGSGKVKQNKIAAMHWRPVETGLNIHASANDINGDAFKDDVDKFLDVDLTARAESSVWNK